MNKKVLLVADDVEMNRNVIRRFLKKDFEVLEATNGVEVLDILKSRQVDLLLLDIIMPEKDGLEVLEEVRDSGDYPNIGILVATSTKEKTERRALSLGADDIVAKPYDPIVIKKRLENILAIHSIQSGDSQEVGTSNSLNVKGELLESLEILRKVANVISATNGSPEMTEEMVKELRKEIKKMKELITDRAED